MDVTPGTLSIARRLAKEPGTVTVENGDVVVVWDGGGHTRFVTHGTLQRRTEYALEFAHELGRVDAWRRAQVVSS